MNIFRQINFIYSGVIKSESFEPSLERREMYALGRACAKEASKEILHQEVGIIGEDADGVPLWPEGTVGSISHNRNYASAVVGLKKNFKSVGFDSECVMSKKKSQRISRLVILESEKKLIEGLSPSPEELITLIFSAKESVFKALFPHIRKMFWFKAAEITRIDYTTHRLSFILTTSLNSMFQKGFSHKIAFLKVEDRIQTLMVLR